MPPLEQLTLRFTGSRLANASGLAQMLDTEQCLARSLKSLQLWFSDLPSLVELGSWEPLTKLQLEELVFQLNRCGQIPPEAKQSWSSLVAKLWTTWTLTPWTTADLGELPFRAATADAMNSMKTFMAFALNIGYCDTAWQWAELSLLFVMQAAAEIQQRTTLAVILLSLYPVACLSLEESLGVPWAAIFALLSVIVLSSIVTTSIRFDTVRAQILQEAVATEASYSQVLQLPENQSVMLRVPTMSCGYADPGELRQQSEDLAGIFLGAQQHLPLLRRAMNVALPDATLKLKLLTNLSDEEERSPPKVLDALRFELMCENMQSVQEAFKGLEDRLASEEMVALGVRIAAVRDTFAEMSGAASGQKCCQVVLQVEDYYSSVFLMDVTLTRLENQLSDLTKGQFWAESNETFLEATCLALPYLVVVVVFLLQLFWRTTSRKRPRPTEVLYEKYFGLRGAYYPFKVAIFQCFTVGVQALGKISLLGGLVTFAQKQQDANAILWLSVGFWAFFALLCVNSLYPAFLLMFPDSAWARIGAAFMDAALDLGYILTYLGMVLVAMLRLQTASEAWGNFGEDLTLQQSHQPRIRLPDQRLGLWRRVFQLGTRMLHCAGLAAHQLELASAAQGRAPKAKMPSKTFWEVFPMTHGQDFTCFPCHCSKNERSAGQRIDSCTLAAVLRQKQAGQITG
eukprot:s2861_g1.t1